MASQDEILEPRLPSKGHTLSAQLTGQSNDFDVHNPRGAYETTFRSPGVSQTYDAFIDPEPRSQSSQNIARPLAEQHTNSTVFSAQRSQRAAQNALQKSQAHFNATAEKKKANDRMTKRQRVTFGEQINLQEESESMFAANTASLSNTPNDLMLRSYQHNPYQTSVSSQQAYEGVQLGSVPRRQMSLKDHLAAARAPTGQAAPGSVSAQSVAPPRRNTKTPGTIYRNLTIGDFNSDPRAMAKVNASDPSPTLRSPLIPSFNFPYQVIVYPTAADIAKTFSEHQMRALLDNLLLDVGLPSPE